MKIKKLLKSKIFWAVVVVLIIVGAIYIRSASQGKKVEYVTEDVKLGNIVQTVSATGKVKSASEIELNFKNSGKLSVLNVKVGDVVKADDLLAQLKASDLGFQVNRAYADLAEARANLDKLKAGATKEDEAVYQAAVNKAETDLANAQDDLINTEATYRQALDNEKQGILVDINSALTKANISLQKVYDTLHYQGSASNFSTANSTLHGQVEFDYDLSLIKVDEAELAYNVANLNPTDEEIDSAVELTLAALTQTSKTLDELGTLLDYVNINTILTQTNLDALKTTINTERTTANSSYSTVQTSKQSLADAELNYQTKVKDAQNSVSVYEKNLAKAQADLDLKIAAARPEDITLYEARVIKAQADLQLAQEKYDETIIRSPIAGVITDINFDLGEQTSLSEPVITMLAAENYEIEVDIPESDIVKISVGDEAEITLDAFSGDDKFKGAITTINPAQTELQDVIYYRVTVTFASDQPDAVKELMEKIKPGMTANVTIKTAEANDILIIPLRAVKGEASRRFVQVLENNKPQSIDVITGLKGDDGLVEVKSGLVAGQKVITFTREGK